MDSSEGIVTKVFKRRYSGGPFAAENDARYFAALRTQQQLYEEYAGLVPGISYIGGVQNGFQQKFLEILFSPNFLNPFPQD